MKYIVATSKFNKKAVIVILVVLFMGGRLFLLNDLYLNGFEYRAKLAECGNKEIIVGKSPIKDSTPRYRLPSDPNYYAPSALAHYFCTEQEARSAGYLPLFNEDGSYNDEYLPPKFD